MNELEFLVGGRKLGRLTPLGGSRCNFATLQQYNTNRMNLMIQHESKMISSNEHKKLLLALKLARY
jgi:hypothetical protein